MGGDRQVSAWGQKEKSPVTSRGASGCGRVTARGRLSEDQSYFIWRSWGCVKGVVLDGVPPRCHRWRDLTLSRLRLVESRVGV